MGLRKIEDEIDLRKAMEKKAAELRLKELQAKASVENLTKERLNEIAKQHGVILALNPKLIKEVETLQKKYNIPTSKIIKEEITENDVVGKKVSKIDHYKLGLLAYQRVLMRKEETGGIFQISEVLELVNTGVLKGNIESKDILKAMRLLKKSKMIEDLKELDAGAAIVHFFPVQFTSDQVKILDLAKSNPYLTVEQVCTSLEWSQERGLRALESLVSTGIAILKDSVLTGKQWFFPSV